MAISGWNALRLLYRLKWFLWVVVNLAFQPATINTNHLITLPGRAIRLSSIMNPIIKIITSWQFCSILSYLPSQSIVEPCPPWKKMQMAGQSELRSSTASIWLFQPHLSDFNHLINNSNYPFPGLFYFISSDIYQISSFNII
jgi:hypothetical protein